MIFFCFSAFIVAVYSCPHCLELVSDTKTAFQGKK